MEPEFIILLTHFTSPPGSKKMVWGANVCGQYSEIPVVGDLILNLDFSRVKDMARVPQVWGMQAVAVPSNIPVGLRPFPMTAL